MKGSAQIAQVRWRSRRGILELDLYLVPFAERGYAELPAAQKAAYLELLKRDDWEILDWLQKRNAPEAPFAAIVECIRDAAGRGRQDTQAAAIAARAEGTEGASVLGGHREAHRPAGSPEASIGLATPPEAQLAGQAPARHEIPWTLGWEWFIAVALAHGLVGAALGWFVSPWWAAAVALSAAWKLLRTRPGERYLLLAFEDAIEVRRGESVLPRRGACWMTERWLVIPTARRVLPVRRGRLSPRNFARLRRAALAGG